MLPQKNQEEKIIISPLISQKIMNMNQIKEEQKRINDIRLHNLAMGRLILAQNRLKKDQDKMNSELIELETLKKANPISIIPLQKRPREELQVDGETPSKRDGEFNENLILEEADEESKKGNFTDSLAAIAMSTGVSLVTLFLSFGMSRLISTCIDKIGSYYINNNESNGKQSLPYQGQPPNELYVQKFTDRDIFR
jgi:hypothetical protein